MAFWTQLSSPRSINHNDILKRSIIPTFRHRYFLLTVWRELKPRFIGYVLRISLFAKRRRLIFFVLLLCYTLTWLYRSLLVDIGLRRMRESGQRTKDNPDWTISSTPWSTRITWKNKSVWLSLRRLPWFKRAASQIKFIWTFLLLIDIFSSFDDEWVLLVPHRFYCWFFPLYKCTSRLSIIASSSYFFTCSSRS